MPIFAVEQPLAYHLTVSAFVHVAATGIFIWDLCCNLKNECRLLFSYKFRPPTIIYFLSRITLLAYCLGRAALFTTTIPSCESFMNWLNAFVIIFLCCMTTFFYLRICAIYNLHTTVVAVFGLSWLATISMAILISQTLVAKRITFADGSPSPFCLESVSSENDYLGPILIVMLINDGMIFAAITAKVYSMFVESGTPLGHKFNVMVFGHSLPMLTKVLFQDSQLYALLSVFTKIITVIFAYAFSGPYRLMLIILHLVIMNILGCKVYRTVRMSPRIHNMPTGTQVLTSVEWNVEYTANPNLNNSWNVPSTPGRGQGDTYRRGQNDTYGIESTRSYGVTLARSGTRLSEHERAMEKKVVDSDSIELDDNHDVEAGSLDGTPASCTSQVQSRRGLVRAASVPAGLGGQKRFGSLTGFNQGGPRRTGSGNTGAGALPPGSYRDVNGNGNGGGARSSWLSEQIGADFLHVLESVERRPSMPNVVPPSPFFQQSPPDFRQQQPPPDFRPQQSPPDFRSDMRRPSSIEKEGANEWDRSSLA